MDPDTIRVDPERVDPAVGPVKLSPLCVTPQLDSNIKAKKGCGAVIVFKKSQLRKQYEGVKCCGAVKIKVSP